MGLWHAFSSTEKEKAMFNVKEFYQYVEANILNYLPEMEGKKVIEFEEFKAKCPIAE